MPNVSSLHVDPLALTALGFFGVVIALSLGLFLWLGARMRRRG